LAKSVHPKQQPKKSTQHLEEELTCEVGILDTYVGRNGFQLENDDLLSPVNTDRIISVRTTVREMSQGNGQGVIKCSCTGNCKTNKCECKMLELLCKSACHGTNTRSKCANLGPSASDLESARPSNSKKKLKLFLLLFDQFKIM
jgi:hypothetical protein